MAGGKGTRISSVRSDIPKPMIKVGDKPVLEHIINCLGRQGIKDIIITVGHLRDIIMNYFGNGDIISPVTQKNFGVSIKYYQELEPLGNAGALFFLKHELTEDFLLINADMLFDVDFSRFINYHLTHKALATIFTHPNNHPYDSGLIIANKYGYVDQWLTKEEERPQYYKNQVNAGLHILSADLIQGNGCKRKIDLDRDILRPLAGSGQLSAYKSPEYIQDMGTPERYRQVCVAWENGVARKKNLQNKQKAVFLDRDGTINRYAGYIKSPDDIQLIEGVAETIKKINQTEFLVIVVTNQPVIARGDITERELAEIHNKIETELGNEGAYINDWFYCPHHPDGGYEGEVACLKIDCTCRKPKPGMLLAAAEKYNIDLTESWMIGDSKSDILAGKAVNCKTVLIGKENFGQDFSLNRFSDFWDIWEPSIRMCR